LTLIAKKHQQSIIKPTNKNIMAEIKKQYSTIVKSILKTFTQNPLEELNYKQVSSRMGFNDRASRQMVLNNILHLAEEEILVESQSGKYHIDPKYITNDFMPSHYVIGKVDMKQTQKAYVIPESGEGEDIYISPNNTNHALNDDKVKVYLFPRRKGKKLEGQITQIIERSRTEFVGHLQIHSRYAFFIPDSPSMPTDIFIPIDDTMGAKEEDKVLVQMTEWPERSNNPFGKVIHIMGKIGENNTEMLSILSEFSFPLSFPDTVEQEASKIPDTIPQEEIAMRRDFRSVMTFTIDPKDAKDFDDAISFRVLDNGNYEVGVHIADVSHYVTPSSALDQEAYKRGTSVYLVDRTIPMLPEKLCNEVCSLRQDEDSLTFSVVFEMNNKSEVLNQWFGKGVIRSDRRFCYEEVQKIIEAQSGEKEEYILPLHKLATILRKERFKTGAINFESQEVKFILDENAKPTGIYIKESKEANWLVEEFMLLANKCVAQKVGAAKKEGKEVKTFVYRVHDEPNPEKLNTFCEFVGKLGYEIKTDSRSALVKSFNNLFVDVAGKGEQNMISSIAIRTMSKAYYSTHNIGHYGLAFPYYTHFTSPIRRYPDLMVHRLLERYLQNGSSVSKEVYEEKCEYCSMMEEKAAQAERTSVKYKQAEFLSDKIGQIFKGDISGISKWGMYVMIEENKCEGLIPIRTLADDFYYIDEDNYQIVGRQSKKTYRLGDPIKIKVEGVDLIKKQLTYSLVDDGEFPAQMREFSAEKEDTKQRKRNSKQRSASTEQRKETPEQRKRKPIARRKRRR
jgi:ribonuclease R